MSYYRANWNDHVWECAWVGDDAFSVLCLNPALDNDGVDQTRWPTDAEVSTVAGAAVQFFDAGDSPRGPEGIFHKELKKC